MTCLILFTIVKEKCKSMEWIFRKRPNPIKQCHKKIDSNLYKSLRNVIQSNRDSQLAKSFYLLAIDQIEQTNFADLDIVVDYLKKSSCLGYHMSTYMLSTFYLHGFGLEQSNEMVFKKKHINFKITFHLNILWACVWKIMITRSYSWRQALWNWDIVLLGLILFEQFQAGLGLAFKLGSIL